ncbi:DUF6630 family protein [Gemella sp. zg-570]|uniref:DUF6630 family protein n=1 Tax=Gemella sp. zg-570 TaxID=2840371 RepID=UPI00352EA444
MITDSNQKVLQKVEKLILQTETYINENTNFLENRGIDKNNIAKEELIWILFSDILIENFYAEKFDWQCELEDFEYLLMNLNQFKTKFQNLKFSNLR